MIHTRTYIYHLQTKFWSCLVWMLSCIVQFILADLFFFIINIIVILPLNLACAVKGKVPELISLPSCELLVTLVDIKSTETFNFLVDRAFARAL